MRISMGIVALGIMVAAQSVSAATWIEYERPDLGYKLDFPGEPIETTGQYTSILIDGAPTHIATVKTETGVFVATVIDLFDRAEDGASLMNELEFFLRLMGDVSDVSTARTLPTSPSRWLVYRCCSHSAVRVRLTPMCLRASSA